MAEATESKQDRRMRLRHEVLTEAHLRKLYADRAVAVGEDGLEGLMNRYMELCDEAKERHDALKVEADKLG